MRNRDQLTLSVESKEGLLNLLGENVFHPEQLPKIIVEILARIPGDNLEEGDYLITQAVLLLQRMARDDLDLRDSSFMKRLEREYSPIRQRLLILMQETTPCS